MQAWLCSGHYVFHNSVSLTRKLLPILNYHLLYQASFQIVAIVLTSLVKTRFAFSCPSQTASLCG